MYEVVWQYDERAPFAGVRPANAGEARRLLEDGNRAFAQFFAQPHAPLAANGDQTAEASRRVVRVSAQDVGLSDRPGEPPPQVPFAAFLSCADARVPVELIFDRQANDLFVVRVAGNVLGNECLGSLGYAVDRLGTVRLLAVLGHTGCGAVTAAVDAYLTPTGYLGVAANLPLQSIISALMAPVRGAALALAAVHGDGVGDRPGYRAALIETAVVLNAALTAAVLAHTYRDALGDQLAVCFGVYDLTRRAVGRPALPDDGRDVPLERLLPVENVPPAGGDVPAEHLYWQSGLFQPPADEDGFQQFAARLAAAPLIGRLLRS